MKKIIIANWKMNPSSYKEGMSLFKDIFLEVSKNKKVDIVFCPPYIYLKNFREITKKNILGAQNVAQNKIGAYTGEISPLMLKDLNINYCIVGHSERREMGESNEDINKKIKLLLSLKMTPILCIGEKERDLEHKYLDFLKEELEESLKGINKNDLQKIIIAYEPIWAIGDKAVREATFSEFREIKIFIKKILHDYFKIKNLNEIKIIYGGSVDKNTIIPFLKEGESDGFLVGRASLDKKKFVEIIRLTENIF